MPNTGSPKLRNREHQRKVKLEGANLVSKAMTAGTYEPMCDNFIVTPTTDRSVLEVSIYIDNTYSRSVSSNTYVRAWSKFIYVDDNGDSTDKNTTATVEGNRATQYAGNASYNKIHHEVVLTQDDLNANGDWEFNAEFYVTTDDTYITTANATAYVKEVL